MGPVLVYDAAEVEREAMEIALANARLRRFAHRAERIVLPVLLTAAASLGLVVAVAQLVKWIGRC